MTRFRRARRYVGARALVLAAVLVTPFTVDAAPSAPAVSVSTPVVRSIVEWDEYTGRFEAVNRIEVRARVSGFLDSVHFEEGSMVAQGDLLFVIDPRPFEARLAAARAELARAEIERENAKLEYARGVRLEAEQAMSREELQERGSTRDAAGAAVSAARSAVRIAELDVEFTDVRAPVSGRVSDARVDVGNLISGGTSTSTVLTTIVSLDPIELVWDASEIEFMKYVRLSREGRRPSSREEKNPVQARLVDETDWVHRGVITFIDNEVDPNSGTMRAKATFPNPDFLLQPGMFARARIPGSGAYEAILIPDEAVMSDQRHKIVMVVGDDDVVAARRVTLGPIVDGLRVVRSGLDADERIIVKGLLRARPGQAVSPEPIDIVPDNDAR